MAAAGFNLFGIGLAQFETLLLILVRVSVMLSMIPIFSAQQVPLLVRFSLGLLIAFVIAHTVPVIAPLDGLGALAAALISQLVLGIAFGFVSFLVFTGLQFAGDLIDTVVGFAAVNVINPVTQTQVTILGELEVSIATLIYLIGDAHHFLLEGIAGSFTLVPLPYAGMQPDFATDIVGFFMRALYLVFLIAAPVVISLLVTNAGLGLMTKVAPQVNIFAVGFALQIGIGLIVLLVSLPLLASVLPAYFADTPRQLDSILRQMVPVK